MIEVLKSLIPNFSHIQEHEVKDALGSVFGFHSTLITTDNYAYAGGSADELNTARRICAAEAIERAIFFKSLKSPTDVSRLLLDEYPTTCGFAAGFDENKTIFRAICEAVERWAWSKWIDEGVKIAQVKPFLTNHLSRYYVGEFDEVIFLRTPLKLNNYLVPSNISKDLVWTVVLGIKGNGIFPGSRVTTQSDEMWEHPLLEAWRHKLIFHNELQKKKCRDLFEERIKYFGQSKEEALKQCRSFASVDFPEAKLRLLENVLIGNDDLHKKYFVYRAICENYIGWDCGNEFRFIY